jgi:hypothetical protein
VVEGEDVSVGVEETVGVLERVPETVDDPDALEVDEAE